MPLPYGFTETFVGFVGSEPANVNTTAFPITSSIFVRYHAPYTVVFGVADIFVNVLVILLSSLIVIFPSDNTVKVLSIPSSST